MYIWTNRCTSNGAIWKHMVEITQEEIQKFIEGHDPQERIVNLVYHYKDNFMKVLYRNEKDQKCVSKEPFYPFCWATRKACESLCGGNREKVKELLARYGIGIKKLRQTDRFGVERHEFDNGYLFMFFAKVPMSYSKFLNFFKDCDNPIYGKRQADGQMGESNRQFMAINPQEQFMIATGKRFFKGYDDYNQLLKMTFDLETTGLNTKKDRIIQIGIKFNRPFYGHPNGFQKIINITGETEEERNKCELWAIEQMLKIIYTFKPDIVTGHNSENFDWNMLIGACERLGTSLEELSSKYFDGEPIRKEERESILKLGGEIEKFHRTILPGIIVTDSLHAVRRAQATDSNFKKADLKYSTKYLKLASKNRVYVPGGEIDKVEADLEEHYAFNNENGDWYLYNPDASKEFKFSGDTKRKYIPEFNNLAEGYTLVSGQYIVERYLYDDLSECEAVETALNGTDFMLTKFIPVTFSKCCTMGTAGQWKSLMMAFSYERELAIPYAEDTGKFTGGLSRLLKVGFVKGIIKLDYNSLYPSIILTWGIEDVMDLLGITLKLLEFVLSTREIHKGLKKAAEKTKEKIEKMLAETAALLTPEELKEYEEARTIFKIEDNRQSVFKKLGNSFFGAYGSNKGAVYPWKSIKCAEQTTCTGRQSLRLMISHFSTLSRLRVFEKEGYFYTAHDGENLGDDYNYEAIVGDTDGFNFALPKKYRYTEEHPYIGKGLNREVKEGVAYTGYKADVAEFNDLYMGKNYFRNAKYLKMGLGIDEVLPASCNLSRKNYMDYFPDKPYPEDVKLVGNTIKSKKMATYIENFLDKACRLLLQGKGQEFMEAYYDYIEKIYNYQIPLRDIASKGKIKKTVKEYIEDVKQVTKAGRPKSRQAWYELAIKHELDVAPGDTIYYINTGKAKSHSDVKKITHIYYYNENGEKVEITKDIESGYKKYTKGGGTKEKSEWINETYPKNFKEEEVLMNCILVPNDIIDKEEDVFCSDVDEDMEYNVAKYIDQFNKRITPLLVCFSREIRSKILITDPKDRMYFTAEECELVAGEPNKPGDQDTYEQLMTMEDKEIRFWLKYDMVPPFLEESGMGKWEDIVADYNERMKIERENGIAAEKEEFLRILDTLTEEEIDDYLDDNKIPAKLETFAELDPESPNFLSKKHGVIIGTMYDFYDAKENVDKMKEALVEVSLT